MKTNHNCCKRRWVFNVKNMFFKQEKADLVEKPESSRSADFYCRYKYLLENAVLGEREECFSGTEKDFYTCHGRCLVSALLSRRCCSWVQMQPNSRAAQSGAMSKSQWKSQYPKFRNAGVSFS